MTGAIDRTRIAGLVLAAGYSSRMGAFKPLLPLGEGSAVENVIRALSGAGIADIRVVVGYRAEDVAGAIAATGARAVPNPDYDKGMYSSVRAGIASLPDDCPGCLLLPVDVPLVLPNTIRQVVDKATRGSSLVVHPTFGERRGHPPFLARALFLEILSDPIGEGGLRAVLARHADQAQTVPVTDEAIVRDMDTPADYQALQALAIRRLAKQALLQDQGLAP